MISLPEVPVFSFDTYGVAFHFLCPDVDASAPSSSPAFQSFERDLLTFSYRDRPPFYSEVLSEVLKPWPSDLVQLQVVFPEILKYTAEGEEKELLTDGPRQCSVRLYASRSVFPTRVLNGVRRGVAVLHLVLGADSPSDGKKNTSATEWDLLKLIKLWEGGEGVDAPDAGSIQKLLRFVPPGTPEGLTLVELVRRVFRLDQGVGLLPRMGTIQIVTGPSDERVNWGSVFDSAHALKDGSPIANDPKLQKQVRAMAGLLQGVLDFPFVDTAELQDVFKLVRIEGTSLIGVHKGTILLMSEEDRAFSAARTTIGISPYLLVPHAVLAYNDYLLGEAYKTDRSVENIRLTLAGRLQEAISKRSFEPLHPLLNRLQAAERAMEETLQKQFLPDVFHYPREKFLYEVGMASRGARDLKQSLERKLPPIHGKWADYREHKKRRHDVILTILLVGIGVLQLIAVIDVLDKWGVVPIAKWLRTWGWLAGTP
jgi:hypothetical protein